MVSASTSLRFASGAQGAMLDDPRSEFSLCSRSSSYSAPATCDTTRRTGRVLWDDRQPRCQQAHCQPVYACLLVHFISSGTVDRVAPAAAIQKVLLGSLHLKAPRFSPISLHFLPPPLLSNWLFGHLRCLLYDTPFQQSSEPRRSIFSPMDLILLFTTHSLSYAPLIYPLWGNMHMHAE